MDENFHKINDIIDSINIELIQKAKDKLQRTLTKNNGIK